MDKLNDKKLYKCKIVERIGVNTKLQGELFDEEKIEFTVPTNTIHNDNGKFGCIAVDILGVNGDRASIVLPAPDLLRGHCISVRNEQLR